MEAVFWQVPVGLGDSGPMVQKATRDEGFGFCMA